MIGLIRADLLKLRKRWLFWILLLILAVLMGISAVFLLIIPSVDPDAIPGLPLFERSDALVLGVQQATGQTWFPLILAVVFLGAEVTTPIWSTSLTQESRRWMHLASKVLVLSVAATVGMLLAIAGWAVIATFFTEGEGLPASTWWDLVWKAALTQLTWTTLGLGAISLVRSTGIAIGIALAFSVFEGIGALWEPYGNVALSGATSALFGNVSQGLGGGFGIMASDPMVFGQAVAVILGWTVLGVAMAVVGLTYRDP